MGSLTPISAVTQSTVCAVLTSILMVLALGVWTFNRIWRGANPTKATCRCGVRLRSRAKRYGWEVYFTDSFKKSFFFWESLACQHFCSVIRIKITSRILIPISEPNLKNVILNFSGLCQKLGKRNSIQTQKCKTDSASRKVTWILENNQIRCRNLKCKTTFHKKIHEVPAPY